MSKRITLLAALLTTGALVMSARAQLSMSWNTIDGGGAMLTSGGAFQVSGTIGQHDAGTMTGGAFELIGGFWPGENQSCSCPGDMNLDGLKNGRDIHMFTTCMIAAGNCSCADMDGVPGQSAADVAQFTAHLLAGTGCP